MDVKIKVDKNPIFVPTYRCNKSCRYCYAPKDGAVMPLRTFERMLGFYGEAVEGNDGVTILGGEPTVIDNFGDYLAVLRDRGLTADIYSNGTFDRSKHPSLMNPKVVRKLYFHFEPSQLTDVEQGNFMENMEAAKGAGISGVTLRYNFHGESFDYETPLGIAQRFGIPLSWSISHPTMNATEYFDQRSFNRIRDKVGAFMEAADSRGVKLKLGVPLPMCLFHEKDFMKYRDRFGLDKQCKPIGDVDPDGTIKYCAVVPNVRFGPIESAEELAHAIGVIRGEADHKLKGMHPFESCEPCKRREEYRCQGGCLAYRLYPGSGHEKEPFGSSPGEPPSE